MNIKSIIKLSILFIFLLFTIGCKTSSKVKKLDSDFISFNTIETDTLFNSNQRIHILTLDNNFFNKFTFDIGYNNVRLQKTSEIAKEKSAIAAINGSFFDVDKGGSVTYFEKNDIVISKTRSSELKWAKPDSLLSGIIIYTKDHKLKIEPAKTDDYYIKSKKEAFAIATGPLLISNSVLQKLPNMAFTHKRHPRTLLCKTQNSILLIAIDGRNQKADGMNLIEIQHFLKRLGVTDAINLDGGGSTTLWFKNKGIINNPSDKKGERTVANAFLLLKKE